MHDREILDYAKSGRCGPVRQRLRLNDVIAVAYLYGISVEDVIGDHFISLEDQIMKPGIRTLFATILLAAGTAGAAVQSPGGVTRTDLQRHDLSVPGRETVQARIDIAPGAVAPWHRHPGEEVIYIIEGTLEYQLEGQSPVTLKAGQVLFVPTGVAHKARNPGTTNGAELATYIVEKGKPLFVPANDIEAR